MKKYILLLLSITAIGLSSCKKEVIAPNNGPPNITLLKYVNPGDWVQSPNKETYSVTIPVSQIDRDRFENDEVALSISRLDNDLYDKMPFVDNAESYSYTYAPGTVTLYLQKTNDANIFPDRPTNKARVKIVLITSNL
ncbi:hypothetical protein HDF26_004809 [Pedobacter cryoconitis]|uniref:hypothetical protein n=1 Tax=Pedobacter cryoconitis TaxID=188932 RepID=UPI001613774A|nr:hypothetical protein [Pedobacter cryoconitis]MBB6274335.1 hypothetical protein [Pedobacter cryoconitis]